MPQGFACSPGAVLWQSRTCLLMTLWSFSFGTFPFCDPSVFMEMVICEQGRRALEGGHTAIGGSCCSEIPGIPWHQWIFIARSLLSVWVRSTRTSGTQSRGAPNHLHPMWFVNSCIQSVIVLSRDVPSSGAHHMGNHRLTFWSASLRFLFSFPTQQKPQQAGGHLGLGAGLFDCTSHKRELPMVWLHITGCFKSGIVDCSFHLDSAPVVGPLVWVASQQEIKLSCP